MYQTLISIEILLRSSLLYLIWQAQWPVITDRRNCTPDSIHERFILKLS